MTSRGSFGLSILVLFMFLAVTLLWVISIGEVRIPAGEIIDVIRGKIPTSDPRSAIVLLIRLPRALAASACGPSGCPRWSQAGRLRGCRGGLRKAHAAVPGKPAAVSPRYCRG